MVVGIEAIGEKPALLNPFRSVWYIIVLSGSYPTWQLTLELGLPALTAWLAVSNISPMVADPDRRSWQAWFALLCAWTVGIAVYTGVFAIGEALLEASFRARLPIWFWIIYYAYVGAYHVNVGLGLFVHVAISSLFGLGAGRALFDKFPSTPAAR
jgi:hypothetical protein